MIDIKFWLEDPDLVKENIKKKFQDEKLKLVDEVIELDEQRRKSQQEADNIKAEKNKLSKQIGALMAQGKRKSEEMVSIIEAKDRQAAGYTAPAKGLCLVKVDYD